MQALIAHPWPGNVRKLGNIAERFVLGMASAALAMPRQPLYYKLRKYGLLPDGGK